MQTVGLVSPGAMGSALASALATGGARVVATVSGRSERTAGFARAAQVELLPDLASVVRDAEVVLSVVPPGEAEAVATRVAACARDARVAPLVADLNAVAPATSRRLGTVVADAGCDYVDGSISGPPPWRPDTTRLYLSGAQAARVAALPFTGVERIVVSGDVGDASAVKMSTASVYKGSTAVLAQALRAAHANGVLEHVLADLGHDAPELVRRAERRIASAAAKSGRFVDEMREIALTQSAAGLTSTLFEAMADVYTEIARTALAGRNPEELPADLGLGDVLDGLGPGATSDRR